MRNPTPLLLAALAVALLNTACGLKAPLYLPEDKKAGQVEPGTSKRRVNNPRPSPQSPKQDRIDAGNAGEQNAPTPADPDRPASPAPPET